MIEHQSWDVPSHETLELRSRSSDYCVCIPVINEGQRLSKQLEGMRNISRTVDVIIADGGSDDGSNDPAALAALGIRTLLIKRDKGRLGAQMRMAFAYALEQGYEGIITVDGNNKDGTEAIPRFVEELAQGTDFVQGSRFLPGGKAVNTPLTRLVAVKLLHIPIISMLAGFRYTDTTNAFRGHSRRLLLDQKLSIFRDVFSGYELLAYISAKAPRLGWETKEVPVTRTYPEGVPPTKISKVRGSAELLSVLFKLAAGHYDPPDVADEEIEPSS